jgi:hypothetical protein
MDTDDMKIIASEINPPSPENRCTIVTCYYRSPAKHTNTQYDEWMENFLTTVENEMVIFCDEESFNKVMILRKDFEDITQVYIMPLNETYCGNENYQKLWKKDWERDIERGIHNPNLYMIWNEKAMFVYRVMQINPFNTEFFCWCDIGCFRNKEDLILFKNGWPRTEFLKTAQKDKMYFLNITPFEEGDFKKYPNGLTRSFEQVTRIGATIFLGHYNIFETYVEKFYKYMNDYISKDYFAGKDQNIIATLYVMHPELFKLVRPVQGEGDPWFYLQRHFLKPEMS